MAPKEWCTTDRAIFIHKKKRLLDLLTLEMFVYAF